MGGLKEQLAAYLAPCNHDWGKHQMKGTRVGREGRNDLNAPTMYVCDRSCGSLPSTLPATLRSNPPT